MSRLENSAKNIFLSFGNTLLSSLLGLAARTVFIYSLGSDYLGLSGLLGNVLGFLSISELGISTAIGFSLYKPLAEKDYKSVSALMTIYRKAYTVIGFLVLISGIVLFRFLDFFVPADQQPDGTDFAYFAFLANTVAGYFLSYKATLISSDNSYFKLVPIQFSFTVLQTILQIAALLIWKNYIIYLSVQIVCSVVSMAVQNVYISKKYKEVDFNSKDKLSEQQKKEIKKNISGLVIAKIGDYLVNSTDNLIITKLVSLAATGLYSNYLVIRNMVNSYIGSIFSNLTAGMGNVVAVESDEKKLGIFDTVFFCAFFVYSFEASCFMCLFNPFIGDIWIGEKFLFPAGTVAIIVLNNFLTGLRIPIITMKGAAGKYLEDSWVPFAFAAVNLAASILLAKPLGVAGVFLGTIIGSALTADWYRPIVIYKTVFHTSVKKYFKKYFLYLLLGVAETATAYFLCSLVPVRNVYFGFIIKAVIAVVIPLALNCLFFFRTKEFASVRTIAARISKGAVKKMKSLLKRRNHE